MIALPRAAPAVVPRPAAAGPVAGRTDAPVAPHPGSQSASEKRAEQPLFAASWSLDALRPKVPLPFPVDPGLPPSPKIQYRSQYQPPDPNALAAADLATLSDFDLALHLIDFSPLERALAPMYRPSHKGQVPFHPVSLFLAICLRRDQASSWRDLADLLASGHGAGWRTRFGFTAGETPSASGLRYVATRIDPALVADLCPRTIALLRTHGLLVEHSTYPGDPPTRGITVCQDGMLHRAHHQATCHWATDACFAPLPPVAPDGTAPAQPDAPPVPPSSPLVSPAPPPPPALPHQAPAGTASRPPAAAGSPQPTATPHRPCRAQEKGWPGCACATPACHQQCIRASTRDPDARFIHYAGRNRTPAGDDPRPAGKGADVFGYRSIADRLIDDRFAVAWTLQSSVYPANTDERTVFPDRLAALRRTFPDLPIGEWLDDAAVGYTDCLNAIWSIGALRMVDCRADPADADPAACLRRGYDGQGHPLCPHGYPLRSNGYDQERRRTKWVCAQTCRRTPLQRDGPIAPVVGCPYLDPGRPLGVCVNVGRTLPDGSVRLAREIPYRSPTWQARYGRRNLAESRNAQIEGMRLKRLPVSGLCRVTKEVHLADFVINLRTIGRLVREATRLARA